MQPEHHLRSLIAQAGPVDVGTFMAIALGHPDGGYYMKGDPLGAAGDFTTAPEISQMFGEMIGAWCADIWRKLGAPQRFILAECGPGRGTLMADALRVTAKVPGFHAAMELNLVEMSPALKEKQSHALASYAPIWRETLDELPTDAPLILIGNEFLDALPVRQAIKTATGWNERVIGLDDAGNFAFFTGGPLALDIVGSEGDIFEFPPARDAFVDGVCHRLGQQTGAALFLDYGHEKTAVGDTLQAMRDHDYVSVLSEPGTADITSHVDFNAIFRIARRANLAVSGPVGQGVFLQRLGIGLRAAMLKKTAEPEQAQAIDSALSRLTADEEMGKLFKAIAICHDEALVPEGFK